MLKTSIWLGYIKKRYLHLQEYQSKQLLTKYNINVQKFVVESNVETLIQNANRHLLKYSQDNKPCTWVIKAQILAGGRGKGYFTDSNLNGGVHLINPTELGNSGLYSLLERMLQHRLVTEQTTSEGVIVRKVMIADAVDIKKEAYFAILLDRQSGGAILLGSHMGGMDIETVAKNHPDAIFKDPVQLQMNSNGKLSLNMKQAENFARILQFPEIAVNQAAQQICNIYDLFSECDATQVEINPFAITSNNNIPNVIAVDAKIQIDDNASFRQQELFATREDTYEQDPREIQALKSSLNYIGLNGNIGCLVNGAGLAMATMDAIQLEGGSPSNFLDVGGNANKSQVKEAFKILSGDHQVKVILVNIFGGIMRCDVIASGMLDALNELDIDMPPIVVRLSGTNSSEGLDLLSKSGKRLSIAFDMDSAAKIAVGISRYNHSKCLSTREFNHENVFASSNK